jgi:mannose-6-phosphate isomerase
MLLRCNVKPYEWGKRGNDSLVAQLLDPEDPTLIVKEDEPYAELWMGVHPAGGSIIKSASADKESPLWLKDYLDENPSALGSAVLNKFGPTLPFLFKVLSVNKALSIQAHPDVDCARVLHESDPKNYPDANHKPELAIALTPFEVLCGFRPLEEIHQFINDIPELATLVLRDVVDPSDDPPDVKTMTITRIFSNLMHSKPSVIAAKVNELLERKEGVPEYELVSRLNVQFPGDVGIFCVYLFNHFTLQPGESVYIPANEPHAYLSGDCVECMANSDNVVRGGLTPKYIDIPTITNLLTFRHREEGWVFKGEESAEQGQGRVMYRPPVAEFAVESIETGKDFTIYSTESCSIAIVLDGECQVNELSMKKGSVAFLQAGVRWDFRIKTKLKLFRAFCPPEVEVIESD